MRTAAAISVGAGSALLKQARERRGLLVNLGLEEAPHGEGSRCGQLVITSLRAKARSFPAKVKLIESKAACVMGKG